jgi:beta-galactosidase
MRHRWLGFGVAAEHKQRVLVRADGVVIVDEEVVVPSAWSDLPRVGIAIEIPERLGRLEWFGRGPEETYPDRCTAQVSRWRSTVEDQYVPYVVPQHHGSHVDTRWAALTDRRGNGLVVVLGGLAFDASLFSVDALTRSQTLAELDPSGGIHLHIDGAIRGVGTGACGPDTTSIVGSGRHRFRWKLVPLSAGEDPGLVARSVG